MGGVQEENSRNRFQTRLSLFFLWESDNMLHFEGVEVGFLT